MIRGKSHHRRPDPFLLLIAVVMLCALMTTAATAGELFNFFPKPESTHQITPEDSGFIVASMGHSGGGVNVSLTPPHELPQNFLNDRGSTQKQELPSHIFLFLRYPW
jgi:hypothetical protein